MKKRFFMVGILALTGLLVFTACPEPDQGSNMSDLKKEIQNAWDAKYNVKIATNASEVAEGYKWVTKPNMDTFNAVIKSAEAVRDNSSSSQSSVDTATETLKEAIVSFENVKQAGSAPSITLSGTITIKNNGRPVPYVQISAHDLSWNWSEKTRLPLRENGVTEWSITTTPLSTEMEILFRVQAFSDDKYVNSLFSIDVRNLTQMVSNGSISGIVIDLANLKTITLSGTINGSYAGKPLPSAQIQVYRVNDIPFLIPFLGEVNIQKVGNNTPWSVVIEAFDSDTEIRFSVYGFNTSIPWENDGDQALFYQSNLATASVKNENKSGIKITFMDVSITLSGTITIKNNGQTIPYVEIIAHDATWNWQEGTRLSSPVANTAWSMITQPLSWEKEISFRVKGYADNTYNPSSMLFSFDVKNLKRWLYNRSIDGININLAELKIITLSGTININYDDSPVPSIVLQAVEENILSILGETIPIVPAVNNTPWSMNIAAFDVDTDIRFSIYGFKGPNGWDDDSLFRLLWQDLDMTVKDQNIDNINITSNISPPITLSGTVNVTYDNEPASFIYIEAFAIKEANNSYYYLGASSIGGYNQWSITTQGQEVNTKLLFNITGNKSAGQSITFYNYDPNIMLDGNGDIPNIVLNLGNWNSGTESWE
ncbi:MAG: hypothetical protein LBI28_01560 [Treponema sp.]|jgi:hypothetical protein|nr:hypothetical protein [Treponema sp.]